MAQKIFGIGLSKTGTTSLTHALKMLGYDAVHYPFNILKYQDGELALNAERINRYDACTDSPIARFFRELDEHFPGSKFVLTQRKMDEWLTSCEHHHVWPGEYAEKVSLRKSPLVRRVLKLHEDLYGSVSFNRESFAKSYVEHEKAVLDYFKDRPDDLLLVDICGGEGWEKLCPFLGQEIPDRHFPRRNVGSDKVFKRTYRKYFWRSLSALSP
ncbi:MAG: hypothetical protein HN337_04695 [Deltaproteobacteria bacterium]|jgi:hypothetical protein|nr:hypothetical protein [Deltaproteobacteria bacterium]